MDELARLLKRLRGLIRQIDACSTLPSPPLFSPDGVSFWHRDFGWLSLTDAEAEAYTDVVAAFVKWVVTDRHGVVGAKEVQRHIQKAILEALDIAARYPGTELRDRVAPALDVLRVRLTCPTKDWTAVVPISGLATTKRVTFGFVTFRTATPAFVRRLQSSGRAIYQQALNSPEVRRAAVARFCDEVGRAFTGSVLALVPVSAVDSEAAWDLARLRLEDTLDALNVLGDIARPGLVRITAGFTEVPLRQGVHMIMSRDQVVGPLVAPVHPLLFEDLLVPGFARTTARWVSALLKAESKELRPRLLTALKWAARAATADRPADQLLQYVICLETLLLDRDPSGGTGHQLGLRCAHLIGRRGRRAVLGERVRRLYRARNNVVHGGNGAIDGRLVARARFYATYSLTRMLAPSGPGRLKTEGELKAWFASRVFAERPGSSDPAFGAVAPRRSRPN